MGIILREGRLGVPAEEMREFLRSEIEDLEGRVESESDRSRLADLYLEYALTCKGEEAIVYAHRAVSLNPDIKLSSESRFLKDYHELRVKEGSQEMTAFLQRTYASSRTPGHMKLLESFLEGIKSEAKKESNAAQKHEGILKMIQRGDIPDPHVYVEDLSGMTDIQLEAEKRKIAKQDLGVGTFLSEMLLSDEEDRRDRKRWKEGRKLPEVSFAQLQTIFSPDYPKHVIINEDALGGITASPARRYDAIDDVCDAICLEISKRMPRRLDAYKFGQDGKADLEIEIAGLGNIKIDLRQCGEGMFTYISFVESESFRIWNCRASGRKYLRRFNDLALPYTVEIKPLELKLEFHKDDEGIFLEEKGIRYTNNICYAVGGCGHKGDSRRDEMYRVGRKVKEDLFDSNFRIKLDKVAPDKSLKAESQRIAGWLKENVLEKILATPEFENQAAAVPGAVPYPNNIGSLYTWIPAKKAEKIELTGGDPSKVYPHERYAMHPESRLVRLCTPGDYPKEANNGFIWCGIGGVKENSSPDEYEIPGHIMDSNNFPGDYRNKLIRVTPKNGEDIFVVDYRAWDDYREEAFKTTEMLTEAQLDENYVALAKTLVPIAEYKGDYKKPVVLIGRKLEFDEVEIVKGVEYKVRRL